MNLKETAILWNPGKDGKIEVTPHPVKPHLYRDLRMSGGACYGHVQKMNKQQATRHLFILAMQCIIRDGMEPLTVHNKLCEIREYRDGLSGDTPVPEHLKCKFYSEVCE